MSIKKEWISAIPKVNAAGNVTEWKVKYKYTDGDFSHIFEKSEKIDTPSKTPNSYTKSELLELMNQEHWDDMFNKKNNAYKNPTPVETTDNDFDINSLT